MTRWVCPRCDRGFGRIRQAHTCVPGNTVAETFVGPRAWQRPICDAVRAFARTLGPVHVDAVGVGVLLKHQATFAELRPMARVRERHGHTRNGRRHSVGWAQKYLIRLG